MVKRATAFEFNEIKISKKELSSGRKKRQSGNLNITFEDVDLDHSKLKTL